ncbi:uncharacterized protein V6R79_007333 [Siganus canaliculatus]
MWKKWSEGMKDGSSFTEWSSGGDGGGGDYRLDRYTQSSSIAAIHHKAIFSSVLPLQPVNTVKQSYQRWCWKSG